MKPAPLRVRLAQRLAKFFSDLRFHLPRISGSSGVDERRSGVGEGRSQDSRHVLRPLDPAGLPPERLLLSRNRPAAIPSRPPDCRETSSAPSGPCPACCLRDDDLDGQRLFRAGHEFAQAHRELAAQIAFPQRPVIAFVGVAPIAKGGAAHRGEKARAREALRFPDPDLPRRIQRVLAGIAADDRVILQPWPSSQATTCGRIAARPLPRGTALGYARLHSCGAHTRVQTHRIAATKVAAA